MSLKIEITCEEALQAKSFKKKKIKASKDGFVNPISKHHVKQFVCNFLKKRGIKRPRIYENGVYSFSNVGMHTDVVSPSTAGTLVFMLSGRGTLLTWDGKKIIQKFLAAGDAVFFDFNLPHSFETEYNCQAILADIPKKYQKQISKSI